MEWLFAEGVATRWACWLKRMTRHLVWTAMAAVAVAELWPVSNDDLAGFIRCARFADVWIVLFLSAVWLDREAEKKRLGRKTLRGTHQVSAEVFNRSVQGDGLGIPYLTHSRPFPGIKGQVVKRYLHVAGQDERRHVLICGDPGTGKSALMHDLLCQIVDRNQDVSHFRNQK